tara:strand:- start:9898 stop:10206 length:309 start_codon:yes stop_codon:yes gene_type:complete
MASRLETSDERGKRKARILDLIYYFGKDAEEWIDLKLVAEDKAIESWRGKNPTEYPPYLCLGCNRYWCYKLNVRKKKVVDYLSRSIFGGIPCDKKICEVCNG